MHCPTKNSRLKLHKIYTRLFFGHFFKNSASPKLDKFQNSANFFLKTQNFGFKTHFSGKNKINLLHKKFKTQGKYQKLGPEFLKTPEFFTKTQFSGK